MNEQYNMIEISWDEKLLKRRAAPQSVEITSKDFNIYLKTNECRSDWEDYMSRQTWLFDNIPEPIYGKLDYKGPIDYMWPYPVRKGMVACINEKVKGIFERLNVSKDEYVLKSIIIKGHEDTPFYLFFVPLCPVSDIIFPACTVVERVVGEGWDCRPVTVPINSHEDYLRAEKRMGIETYIRELVVKDKYRKKDIITFQGFVPVFFSERIVNAFREENVVGAAIPSGGLSYCSLAFQ